MLFALCVAVFANLTAPEPVRVNCDMVELSYLTKAVGNCMGLDDAHAAGKTTTITCHPVKLPNETVVLEVRYLTSAIYRRDTAAVVKEVKL